MNNKIQATIDIIIIFDITIFKFFQLRDPSNHL